MLPQRLLSRSKEKLIVHKQFDRYVIGNLGEILEEANKSSGTSRHFTQPKIPGSQILKFCPGLQATIRHLQFRPTRGDEASRDVFGQIQNLLATTEAIRADSLAIDASPAGTRDRAGRGYHINELMSLLGRIQPSSSPDNLAEGPVVAMDEEPRYRRYSIRVSTHRHRAWAVEQIDDDLINLVAMLFEFILDDYNLSALIQVLISRLQIPISKLQSRIRASSANPSHPARRLFNALAKAGIGWSESSEQKETSCTEHILWTVPTHPDRIQRRYSPL